jgi:hypothetical protein
LTFSGHTATFDLRQAKGAPNNQKGLSFVDRAGELIRHIDLGESGGQAHARILKALTQPKAEMHHTLSDAINILKLIEISRVYASETTSYPFNGLPEFLRDAEPQITEQATSCLVTV